MNRLPNRSYSLDFKEALLKEFKSCNKSYKEFAQEKDIPWRTFYDWINRPNKGKTIRKAPKASFAPISIKETPKQDTILKQESIILIYPNGVEIKMPSTTDLSVICSLIKVF